MNERVVIGPGGDWDTEVDVLVVGAGGCGLAAAIAAHDEGAQVAVLEKLDRPGGNTALSTGSIPGAGSRFQREAGIDDSPAVLAADLQRIAGDQDLPALTRRMVELSAPLCEWLVDVVGARISLVTDYCHVGHTVPRLHAPVSRRGQDLLDDLLAAVARRGIPIAVNNPVRTLVGSADGGIVGVEVGDAGGSGRAGRVASSRIGARKVVLACNGFAGDRELVQRFCPEIAGAEYFGARGSTGDAVRWGEALGAALANMAAYQGYGAVTYPHGSLLSWTTIEKGGILVNAEGRRFGDEGLGYSAFARHVLAQDTPVYAIFDDRIRAIASKEEEFVELVEHGGIRRADSVAALAAHVGLPQAALERTLERYAQAACGGAPDETGRTAFGIAPLSLPLYIVRVTPGLFHTQGGLAIDVDGRVLRADGRAIPNLFAGGGAAGGISGRSGAGGYASGNGLLTAVGIGYLAGRAAAREIAGDDGASRP